MFKILLNCAIFGALLFFSACAEPQIVEKRVEKIPESELKLVLIKNDKIRFYDFGHLLTRESVNLAQDSMNPDSVNSSSANAQDSMNPDLVNLASSKLAPNEIASLELFRFGQSIGKFILKDSEVCFINDCAPKWPASKAFFGKVAYDDLFEDILLKKDIFEGIGKELGADGAVIQRFKFSDEEIFYERKKGVIFYKNLTTGMTISIEDYIKD